MSKNALRPTEVKFDDFEGAWKCISINNEGAGRFDYNSGRNQIVGREPREINLLIRRDHSFTLVSKHHEVGTVYKGYIEITPQNTVVAHKILGPVIDTNDASKANNDWVIRSLKNRIYLDVGGNVTYIFEKEELSE